MEPSVEKTGRDTRQQLIEAAASVFSEEGVRGATTREIAKRAGVHETTLFRHFESKDELLRAVIEQLSADMTASLAAYPQVWSEDLSKDLMLYAEVFSHAIRKNELLMRMLIAEGGKHPQLLREIVQSANFSFREHMMAYLDQAKLMGQIRPELDSFHIATMLTGVILAGVLRGFIGKDEAASQKYLQDSLDIFIHGLETR